jgi:hypothetical protein
MNSPVVAVTQPTGSSRYGFGSGHSRSAATANGEGADERIAEHMSAGRVRVDGELVTDLDAPAPAGRRVVIWTG